MIWEVFWSTFDEDVYGWKRVMRCKRKRCADYEEAAVEAAAMDPSYNAQPVPVPTWVFKR